MPDFVCISSVIVNSSYSFQCISLHQKYSIIFNDKNETAYHDRTASSG